LENSPSELRNSLQLGCGRVLRFSHSELINFLPLGGGKVRRISPSELREFPSTWWWQVMEKFSL
jgi:hypothetical protein